MRADVAGVNKSVNTLRSGGVSERPNHLKLVRLILVRQRRLGQSSDQGWAIALAALPPMGMNRVRQDREATRRSVPAEA
jgi:hypothetical protein